MTVPSVAWLNGELVPFAEAKVPLEDRGLELGESLYEVASLTNGRVRLVAEHAARMRAAAEEIGIARGVPDDARFEAIARELVAREGLDEGILYAQVTGGTAPRAHVPDADPTPTFFAYLRPHRFPRADDVARGIAAITMRDPRWERCDMKTTMLLPAVLARRAAKARGASEVLFHDDTGEVREGAASALLLVEGTRLLAPRPTHHNLPSTTGPLVRALAREAGLDIARDRVDLDRLRRADEVAVASATFLVMPVTRLDGAAVGDETAGPVLRDLASRLRRRLELPD
jgi:D-alanine transaminase